MSDENYAEVVVKSVEAGGSEYGGDEADECWHSQDQVVESRDGEEIVGEDKDEENAEGVHFAELDGADDREGAADGADSDVAVGADDSKYHAEGEGTTRDGEWNEMECVDADDSNAVDDVNGNAGAEDEEAVAEVSNHKAEKSEKAEKRARDKPEKPDETSGHSMLGPCKGQCQPETVLQPVAETTAGALHESLRRAEENQGAQGEAAETAGLKPEAASKVAEAASKP
ncbi:hypothetical protein MTO96_029194 [Rhipicephalus appendiculatus]